MVAEKPSLSQSIAHILSEGRMASRRAALDVHEFDGRFRGQAARFKMTSIQAGRKVVPTELGITLIRGYQLIDPELCKPQWLYCNTCEEVLALPQGGTIKLYKSLVCPLDGYELLLFSLSGHDGKTFPLCPFCLRGRSRCACGHRPDSRPSGGARGRGGRGGQQGRHALLHLAPPQPRCQGGTVVLDPVSAPKWRLDCNRCNFLIYLPANLHSAKVTKDMCKALYADNFEEDVEVLRQAPNNLPDITILRGTRCAPRSLLGTGWGTGDTVYAFGFSPSLRDPGFSKGVVSCGTVGSVAITALADNGYSGGPVLSSRERLVGIMKGSLGATIMQVGITPAADLHTFLLQSGQPGLLG
ncbi:hypothetical protein GPECTOR_11g102 [Gonium pectorale]|uniref:DNA topoisomerase n=1 Tax=Gonium pectorale TaxID=33097 RepID=A0A150GPI4_GONPE|nr:hypothetical protein GPECTOR_11g102 [Gonium pectorale]|eukprot:KXZ51648.1 hypothetical protein GPECTOR_11g102 [Gonium pectorale]